MPIPYIPFKTSAFAAARDPGVAPDGGARPAAKA